MNWYDRTLIVHRLRSQATTEKQHALCNFIENNKRWCWDGLYANATDASARAWAMSTMREWLREGDNAPAILLYWRG